MEQGKVSGQVAGENELLAVVTNEYFIFEKIL